MRREWGQHPGYCGEEQNMQQKSCLFDICNWKLKKIPVLEKRYSTLESNRGGEKQKPSIIVLALPKVPSVS